MDEKGWLTVGEAARAANLTRKAIRVYESKGLVTPTARTSTGYRRYSAVEVETLQFIRRARALGLGLDDVAEILAVRRGGGLTCPTVLARIEQRVSEVDAAINDLQALRRSLLEAANQCAHVAPEASSVCPVLDPPGPT
jgi:MerR family copper efflux transcriptional regulator